jgi:hypothetical protein
MQINQSTLIQTQITMLERSIAELNKRLALLEVKQDIIQDDVDELYEQDCTTFYGSIKSGR